VEEAVMIELGTIIGGISAIIIMGGVESVLETFTGGVSASNS
jgi:hypothetical protein